MIRKKIISIIIFTTLLFSQQENYDKEILSAENQISILKKELQKNSSELKSLETKSVKEEDRLVSLQKSINNSVSLINAYDQKINLYEKQLTNLNQAVQRNNIKIEKIKSDYAKQSIHLYKNDRTLNDYLFSSKSINQMFYRIKYFSVLSEINRQNLNQLSITQQYNFTKENEISSTLAKTKADKVDRGKEIQNLAQLREKQRKIIRTIEKNKQEIQNRINDQKKQINELENLRLKIIADKKKYEEKQLVQYQKIEGSFSKNQGKLSWPVEGKVVKGFGPKWNPELKTTIDNPGIDFETRPSEAVRVVFDGVVTVITFISGYGTTVIIDHNNDFYTVYTHLQNLNVNENSSVSEGEIIGYVSLNKNFHFEVWGQNKKLNPMTWLNDKN